MSGPRQITASDAAESSWFRALADANATLPSWLLIVFLIAGLTGFAVGLFSLLAG
jgi:uncharacterized membrane protein